MLGKERTSELKKAGRYPKEIFGGRRGDPFGVDRNGLQPTVCPPGRRISNGTGGSGDFRATRRPGGRGLQRGRNKSAATGLIPFSPYPSIPPGCDGLYLRETEHELPDFSSLLPAVWGGSRQGFKWFHLFIADDCISTDNPTGQIYFVGHGMLLFEEWEETKNRFSGEDRVTHRTWNMGYGFVHP